MVDSTSIEATFRPGQSPVPEVPRLMSKEHGVILFNVPVYNCVSVYAVPSPAQGRNMHGHHRPVQVQGLVKIWPVTARDIVRYIIACEWNFPTVATTSFRTVLPPVRFVASSRVV